MGQASLVEHFCSQVLTFPFSLIHGEGSFTLRLVSLSCLLSTGNWLPEGQRDIFASVPAIEGRGMASITSDIPF